MVKSSYMVDCLMKRFELQIDRCMGMHIQALQCMYLSVTNKQ